MLVAINNLTILVFNAQHRITEEGGGGGAGA